MVDEIIQAGGVQSGRADRRGRQMTELEEVVIGGVLVGVVIRQRLADSSRAPRSRCGAVPGIECGKRGLVGRRGRGPKTRARPRGNRDRNRTALRTIARHRHLTRSGRLGLGLGLGSKIKLFLIHCGSSIPPSLHPTTGYLPIPSDFCFGLLAGLKTRCF